MSAVNAKSLLVSISGATNAAETDVVIPLTTVDPYTAVGGYPAIDENGKVYAKYGPAAPVMAFVAGFADPTSNANSAFGSNAYMNITPAFANMFNVADPALTAASANQSGDAFARLGRRPVRPWRPTWPKSTPIPTRAALSWYRQAGPPLPTPCSIERWNRNRHKPSPGDADHGRRAGRQSQRRRQRHRNASRDSTA